MLPTRTLPKFTLAGFAESCPCVPVPLKGMASGDPEALLVMEIPPLTLPVEVGANVAFRVVV